MQPAVAEKGLMVLDCTAIGKAGHAARNEGVNAIYEALPDIEWFRSYVFPEQSDFLGPVKMSVTMINAGTQHNVVPALGSSFPAADGYDGFEAVRFTNIK